MRRDPFFDENFDPKAMEEAEKIDILRRLKILEQKGVPMMRKLTAKSSLADLRMEIGRIERERQVATHIKLQQRGLMISIAGG